MKTTKIELTSEQIEMLVKSATEQLLKDKEKAIKKLNDDFDADVEKLKNKFKYFEVPMSDEPVIEKRQNTKIDADGIKERHSKGLSVGDIAKEMGYKYTQVYTVATRLGLIKK